MVRSATWFGRVKCERKTRRGEALRWALTALAAGLLLGAAHPAVAQSWPDVFDPGQLLTLNLTMDPGDWTTVQGDTSFSIEVPAQFWLDGEASMLISVRRKSDPALSAGTGFNKVSLSLDINDLVGGQTWHDLKKLSLENGGDSNVISEGFAWQMVRLAGTTQGFGYSAGYASWVRLIINGVDTGVYVNAEKRDKRFLENRGLFLDGFTWLYEVEDQNGGLIFQLGGPQDSPTVEQLCYSPFELSSPCATPDLATELPQYIEMPGLLTELAIDAFTGNGDALLTAGKNFYFADSTYPAAPLRMYFPWDLDGAKFNNQTKSASIYGPSNASPYADLLDVTEIRAQYSQITNDLICGPWSDASLTNLLDTIEPVLSAALTADPNHDGSENSFSNVRSWVSARITNVIGQIEGFQTCPTVQLQVNEVMAANGAFLEDPVEPGEYPDWFEIYNPAAKSVDVDGVYLTDDPLDPTKYQFPIGVTIPARGYYRVYADDDGTQGPDHTNFKLSNTGESVAIYDRDGVTQLDIVTFGPQFTDVAYGRYPDGSGPFDFMPTPTPGQANAPHNPPPMIHQTVRDIDLPEDTDTVVVTVVASDDSAIVSVTLHCDGGYGDQQFAMFDDGISVDGSSGDGVYSGSIPPFATDSIVRYWVEASDDLGATSVEPLSAPATTHVYVVGYTPPPLIVNEFMASNATFIEDPDEPLAHEDWLEIYNGGTSPVSLDGMYLSDNLLFPTKFALPTGLTVPAHGQLLLWADGEPLQGINHLGFKLAAIGEEIGIADVDARGNMQVDAVSFGPQLTDTAEGSCPDGYAEVEALTSPSPGAPNLGEPGCVSGSNIVFGGVASGGDIIVTLADVPVGITTFPGDTSAEVALMLSDSINADATLAGMGMGANALSSRLIANGPFDDVTINDPTISLPEPSALWQLIAGTALLQVLRSRRAAAAGRPPGA
jgi:hypothetical protein